MKATAIGLATALCLGAAPLHAGDYLLTLIDSKLREYYCQITVTLENTTDAPLTEISGFFYAYIGDEEVGRSKGAWFMNVPAGGVAEATFETPNAPCDEVERYEFVLGACRLAGPGFEDVATCAPLIGGAAPLVMAGS